MVLIFIKTNNYQISLALFIVDVYRPFNTLLDNALWFRSKMRLCSALGVGVRDLYRATPRVTRRLGF